MNIRPSNYRRWLRYWLHEFRNLKCVRDAITPVRLAFQIT